MNPEKIPYNEGRGYSLWLMPDQLQSNKLERIIKKLSRTYGSHAFKPHMTLLGSIQMDKREVIKRASTLSGKMKKMRVHALRASEGPLYFKSVFIEAELDRGLSRYYSAACEIFSIRTGKLNPHISLLYGRLNARERKKAINLIDYNDTLISFNRLCAFDTSGKVESWKRVASFALK